MSSPANKNAAAKNAASIRATVANAQKQQNQTPVGRTTEGTVLSINDQAKKIVEEKLIKQLGPGNRGILELYAKLHANKANAVKGTNGAAQAGPPVIFEENVSVNAAPVNAAAAAREQAEQNGTAFSNLRKSRRSRNNRSRRNNRNRSRKNRK